MNAFAILENHTWKRLQTLMHTLAHTGPSADADAKAKDAVIRIVGVNGFNNDLLAIYLQEQTGVDCAYLHGRTPKAIPDHPPEQTRLILFDCTDLNHTAIASFLPNSHQTDASCLLACFNVDPEHHIEQQALHNGVRGVIYKNTPPDVYPKAAQAMLDGELWYPRKELQRYLLAAEAPKPQPQAQVPPLTRRERTILTMMAEGISNKQIAGKLNISPHTVKTHAYNLYKKINVHNRFQATRWLSQNKSCP